MDYIEYKRDFLETVRNDADILGTDVSDEYLQKSLGILRDFEEIEEPIILKLGEKRCSGQRIMRIDGYSFDETDHSLLLIINDFQDIDSPSNLTMSRVDELYWKMYYFLEESCNGKLANYVETDEVVKVARLIRNRMNAVADDPQLILKVKFHIITNRELDTNLLDKNLLQTTMRKSKRLKKTKTTKKIKKSDFLGKPLEINLWYPERFFDMESSNQSDPIFIDFQNDFNSKGIPCIKGSIGDDLGYEAYIAIIPGKLLADIYIEYGSRVLEGNVRAFLGTSNSKGVNNGIKKTINGDPTKFFTYNNGIATTAADVEVEEINGELLITRILDLQIINGGQTTATLAESVLKKTNIDLAGIYVPMKLTVIDDRETEDEEGVRFYDQMVQAIAKYANSQNKVTASDLFSNDPFHIWMERMSKRILAPTALYPIPTGWYYERSRKKYEQEQIKLRGEDVRRFVSKFPKKQLINKEQLAVYLTSISCKPHIVSKGKNWVIKEFGAAIGNEYRANKAVFNEFYFKKCICAAIIFRTVDNYLETNKKNPDFWYKPGGYKLNIVPYSIAKIISSIPRGYTINWEAIWRKQTVSPVFLKEIEIVTKLTNDFICDSHGIIVTEYCKKEDTWNSYRDANIYKPSDEFINELIPSSIEKEQEQSALKDQKETNDLTQVMEIIELGFDYWEGLLKEGINRNLLSHPEQAYLREAVDLAKKGIIPCSSTGKVPSRIMNIVKSITAIKDKLESEGLYITTDGVVNLILTDYKMK
jgi:hypothetical protein